MKMIIIVLLLKMTQDDIATMLSLKPDYEGLLEYDDLPNQHRSSDSNTGRQNDFPEHWTRMDNMVSHISRVLISEYFKRVCVMP